MKYYRRWPVVLLQLWGAQLQSNFAALPPICERQWNRGKKNHEVFLSLRNLQSLRRLNGSKGRERNSGSHFFYSFFKWQTLPSCLSKIKYYIDPNLENKEQFQWTGLGTDLTWSLTYSSLSTPRRPLWYLYGTWGSLEFSVKSLRGSLREIFSIYRKKLENSGKTLSSFFSPFNVLCPHK